MFEKTLDFVILTTQRSGSHMLSSALNSHPNISCEGELGVRDEVVPPSEGEVKGAILMYNRWHTLGKRFSATKIIHLVRNPVNTAKSRLANSQDKKENKGKHKAHYRKKASREFELNGKRLKEVKAHIVTEIRRMRATIQPILHIEGSSEELTGDASVAQLPQEVSDRLTAFLEVSSAPLTTDLVKPDTSYIVND